MLLWLTLKIKLMMRLLKFLVKISIAISSEEKKLDSHSRKLKILSAWSIIASVAAVGIRQEKRINLDVVGKWLKVKLDNNKPIDCIISLLKNVIASFGIIIVINYLASGHNFHFFILIKILGSNKQQEKNTSPKRNQNCQHTCPTKRNNSWFVAVSIFRELQNNPKYLIVNAINSKCCQPMRTIRNPYTICKKTYTSELKSLITLLQN